MPALPRPSRPTLALVGAMGLGCAGILESFDRTPARIEIQLPTEPRLDGTPVVLRGQVYTEKGRALPDDVAPLAWAVTPPEVAELSDEGVRCLKSGDVTVAALAGEVRAKGTLRCRMVAEISGPNELKLFLGEAAQPVPTAPLDAEGIPVPDVEVQLRSEDPQVAVVEAGKVVPLAVGATTLVARAGRARVDIPVKVWQRVRGETLTVQDGETYGFTLEKGRYRIEVFVRAEDGSGYGVSVSDGGGWCSSSSENTRHVVDCDIPTTTSIAITNPQNARRGPAEVGNMTIYRIP
jgi:hypothetical protein